MSSLGLPRFYHFLIHPLGMLMPSGAQIDDLVDANYSDKLIKGFETEWFEY